jgi:hypothetical protein
MGWPSRGVRAARRLFEILFLQRNETMSVAVLERAAQGTGPTKESLAAYREHVYDMAEAPDGKILEAAWKLPLDYEADVFMYQRRLSSCDDLDKRLPALAAKIKEAHEAARRCPPYAVRPLSSFETLGELREALKKMDLGFIPPEVAKAKSLQSDYEQLKASATRFLKETADPDLEKRIGELRPAVAETQAAIESRAGIVNVDEAISAQKNFIDDLHHDRVEFSMHISGGITKEPSKAERYFAARTKLDNLRRLREQRPAANAANDRDTAKLHELQGKIGDLESAKLDPKNMRWHE